MKTTLDNFLKEFPAYIKLTLESGNDLLGVYIIGSLAHGGFNMHFSDIDLAIVTEHPLESSYLEKIKIESSTWNKDLSSKVSLFWTDKTFISGRFPILDQIDYLDHRIALFEKKIAVPERPALHDVRKYLLDHPMDYWREKSKYYFELKIWSPKETKEFVRCLLYPARFTYTYSTGLMTSNDIAVNYIKELAGNNKIFNFGNSEGDELLVEPILDAMSVRRARVDGEEIFKKYRFILMSQLNSILKWVSYEDRRFI
ncbi:MAG: nucleotidyltransferase domain-containing protein [Pseudobdellovibrionaceae bacterium]